MKIIVLLLALASNNAIAQRLVPGDPVPAVSFNILAGGKIINKSLNDFGDGLIILDFWATWCSGCIQGFPKMDSLQNEFAGQLQVILVNSKSAGDDTTKIRSFFARKKKKDGSLYNFTNAVLDTAAEKFFPYQMVPQYAWIKSGRLLAVTDAGQVTHNNVRDILLGKKITLRQKNDFLDFDPGKPLFIDGNAGEPGNLKYRTLVTGYIAGLPSGSAVDMDPEGRITRYCFYNSTLLQLLQLAHDVSFASNRVITPAGERDLFVFADWDTWKYDHAVSYEIITLPLNRASFRLKLQDDILYYFGYRARTGKQTVKCLVLKQYPAVKKTTSTKGAASSGFDLNEGTIYIRNTDIATLGSFLDERLELPFINETGLLQPASITISGDIKDVANLQREFGRQGYLLVVEDREVEVLVVEKVGR